MSPLLAVVKSLLEGAVLCSHQAQECFCGEPMCVGYIGGKTQTDIATMDDLYLDALGITDEDDLMELKGTKKKKGKKIDDPDFMVSLSSLSTSPKLTCRPANYEGHRREGSAQSRAGHSSDNESQSPFEIAH